MSSCCVQKIISPGIAFILLRKRRYWVSNVGISWENHLDAISFLFFSSFFYNSLDLSDRLITASFWILSVVEFEYLNEIVIYSHSVWITVDKHVKTAFLYDSFIVFITSQCCKTKSRSWNYYGAKYTAERNLLHNIKC